MPFTPLGVKVLQTGCESASIKIQKFTELRKIKKEITKFDFFQFDELLIFFLVHLRTPSVLKFYRRGVKVRRKNSNVQRIEKIGKNEKFILTFIVRCPITKGHSLSY